MHHQREAHPEFAFRHFSEPHVLVGNETGGTVADAASPLDDFPSSVA
jgi:hypothetical protein